MTDEDKSELKRIIKEKYDALAEHAYDMIVQTEEAIPKDFPNRDAVIKQIMASGSARVMQVLAEYKKVMPDVIKEFKEKNGI